MHVHVAIHYRTQIYTVNILFRSGKIKILGKYIKYFIHINIYNTNITNNTNISITISTNISNHGLVS